MSICVSHETLKQLLSGQLAEAESHTVRQHLAGCASCQECLDRLSDHPLLRQWKAESGTSAAAPDNPRLEPLLERLEALLGDLSTPLSKHHPGAALHFLGPPAQDGDLGTLGSYRILGELGRGGMGIVLRGREEALARTVAIKVLRPELANERTRARFLREAQAAARVKHDHLVGVFAVVNPLDGGLPYFAMEYLDGPTLAERTHKSKRLNPHEAAALAAQVADGLAAAHAAGLVHRDIKPGNIMLDPETGRARIMDFGLARLDAVPSELTQEGALSGTPAYMSPEQARGAEAVDARSDIYSLGITLYEMLTGDVPFRGAPHMVLRQVLEEEPQPPRRLNDAVPRDLETICLKALAKEPGRRYQTAGDFAADLRRWRQGEPIKARPVGRLERGWRWCRRNPWLSGLAAALVLVFLAGFGGVTWQWQRAEAKSREADDQRARAVDNLRQAEDTLRESVGAVYELVLVSEGELRTRAGLQPFRQKLVSDALAYCQRLQQQWGDLIGGNLLPKCYLLLGIITRENGKLEDALAAYRHALPLFEKALRASPSAGGWNYLATIHFYIGEVQAETGEVEEAMRSYRQARVLWEEIVRDDPDHPWWRRNLAVIDCVMAKVDLARGRPTEALHAYQQARPALERLVSEHPQDTRYLKQLASCDHDLGLAHLACGDQDQALACLKRARDCQEGLVLGEPADIWWQWYLARTEQSLGRVYRARGQPAEALASLERARTAFEPLVRESPTMTDFQRELAGTWLALGHLHCEQCRWDEARRAFEQARDIHQRLLLVNPAMTRCRAGLAECQAGLGRLDQKAGRGEPAPSPR